MGWRPVLAQYSNPYAETVHVAIRDVETGAVQVVKSNRIHPFFAQREAQGAGLYSPAAMTPPPPSSEGHVYRCPITSEAIQHTARAMAVGAEKLPANFRAPWRRSGPEVASLGF